MYTLIQRVTQSAVEVEQQCVGSIEQGLMVLVGFEKQDEASKLQKAVDRLLGYRVFEDSQGQMNLSLKDVQGGLLLVPQFTLAAETQKGLRPSFSKAKPPAEAALLFEDLVALAKQSYPYVATGQFGARMAVSLINDGPVTFMLKI